MEPRWRSFKLFSFTVSLPSSLRLVRGSNLFLILVFSQLCKMLVLATFFPSSENTEFSFMAVSWQLISIARRFPNKILLGIPAVIGWSDRSHRFGLCSLKNTRQIPQQTNHGWTSLGSRWNPLFPWINTLGGSWYRIFLDVHSKMSRGQHPSYSAHYYSNSLVALLSSRSQQEVRANSDHLPAQHRI